MSFEGEWQKAKVVSSRQASSDILSLVLEPKSWVAHRAGQHYQLRVIGQSLGRCYSIVSSPLQTGLLEFGIQLIASGEVSPKLWRLTVGEEVEIKGPLGEGFVWEEKMPEPVILIGAGSGITPLISIFSHYKDVRPSGRVKFIMSSKAVERIMDYDSLKDHLVTRITSIEGRIDKNFLVKNLKDLLSEARVYVCGPTDFIDDMVDYLLDLGVDDDKIKSERFI